ncbi:MAG: hypothetical protein IJC35_07385 [Oscillospiraceae bacterium]|nr:hypothetical protein [Oscillospiraceae bacterium]
MVYDIRSFGAAADGITNDAAAIQAAADACVDAGSGTVLIPAGRYVTSSVRLYSNTTVRIEAGAELLLESSEDAYGKLRGKYDQLYTRDAATLLNLPEGTELGYIKGMFLGGRRGHTDNLFYAKDAENILIEGGGVLNGQWRKFFEPQPDLSHLRKPRWLRSSDEAKFTPKIFRPQFIYMQDCKNIRIRNLSLLNCPFFNIRITDSEHICCENLNILADKRCLNTDGINLAGCRHCVITGCHIVTGDDCIAISSGEMPPRRYSAEDIIVRDCIGNTKTNFVRIFIGLDVNVCLEEGIGSADAVLAANAQAVRHIRITNCALEEEGCTANIMAVYGKIEDIHIEDITVDQKGKAPMLFLAIQKEGRIRDVTVNGLKGLGKGAVTVLGTSRESISGLVFQNCRFRVEPASKLFVNGMPDPLEQYWMYYFAPCNIYLRHATDVRFHDCEVEWGEADIDDIYEIADPTKRPEMYNAVWREDMGPFDSWPCIDAFDVDGLDIRNFRGEGFGGCEAVRVRK